MVLVLRARVLWLTGHSADSEQYSISGSQTQSPSCSQWWPGRKRTAAPPEMQQKGSGVELSSIQVFISFRCFCRRRWHSCNSLTTWNDGWIQFNIAWHQWLQCYFTTISECKKTPKTFDWNLFLLQITLPDPQLTRCFFFCLQVFLWKVQSHSLLRFQGKRSFNLYNQEQLHFLIKTFSTSSCTA